MSGNCQGIKKKMRCNAIYLMISTSTYKLKVVFRYVLQLYRINIERIVLAYVNSLALVLLGDGMGSFFPFKKKVYPKLQNVRGGLL